MKQVVLWTPGAHFETLAPIEASIADNRLNEGQVAPDGSYWVGTMQNNLTAQGEPKRGGSVCLTSLRGFAKWTWALVMPLPGLAYTREPTIRRA